MAGDVLLPAAGTRQGELLVQVANLFEHTRVIRPVGLGAGIDAGGEDRHQICSILATYDFMTSSAPPPMLTRRVSTNARAAGFSQQ